MSMLESFPPHDYFLKFLLVGDSDVGKHEILNYLDGHHENHFSGINSKTTLFYLEDKKIKLQLWDTSGQGRFCTIIRSYSRGAHGVLLVYDITNKWSFKGIDRWLKEIDNHIPGIPKVLVGNRLHLEYKREISQEAGQQYAFKNKMEFFEISPLCNFNVKESVQELVTLALHRIGMQNVWSCKTVKSLQELTFLSVMRYVKFYQINRLCLPDLLKGQLKSYYITNHRRKDELRTLPASLTNHHHHKSAAHATSHHRHTHSLSNSLNLSINSSSIANQQPSSFYTKGSPKFITSSLGWLKSHPFEGLLTATPLAKFNYRKLLAYKRSFSTFPKRGSKKPSRRESPLQTLFVPANNNNVDVNVNNIISTPSPCIQQSYSSENNLGLSNNTITAITLCASINPNLSSKLSETQLKPNGNASNMPRKISSFPKFSASFKRYLPIITTNKLHCNTDQNASTHRLYYNTTEESLRPNNNILHSEERKQKFNRLITTLKLSSISCFNIDPTN